MPVNEPRKQIKSTESRYADLAHEIVRDITNGVFSVGSILPKEVELAEQHRVSRGTVRTALRMVQDLGLISRKKRAGTRVEHIQLRQEYSPAISSIEELTQSYGAIAQRKVHFIKEIVVDIALSRHLGMAAGTRWLHIGVSGADPAVPGRLINWSDIYVDAEAGKRIRKLVRSSDELICDLVQRVTGRVVMEVQQRIRSISIPDEVAKRLGTEPNAPALEFTRHHLDQSGSFLEVVTAIHPGDRFTYFTRLRRLKS